MRQRHDKHPPETTLPEVTVVLRFLNGCCKKQGRKKKKKRNKPGENVGVLP